MAELTTLQICGLAAWLSSVQALWLCKLEELAA